MKCPVCKAHTLGRISLVEDLPASQCERCGGVWVDSNAFLAWRRARGEDLPEKTGAQIDPQWDTQTLKLCPNGGNVMARFKVLPGVELYVDRCAQCNGMWFDNHEWEALVERNLHDNLNEFFTHVWQDRLHAGERQIRMEKLYLEKFGRDDYERIREIHTWLKDHAQRSMLLAFLQADDPYQV